MGGRHLFPFNREMQAATGKGPGDAVLAYSHRKELVRWIEEAKRPGRGPEEVSGALRRRA